MNYPTILADLGKHLHTERPVKDNRNNWGDHEGPPNLPWDVSALGNLLDIILFNKPSTKNIKISPYSKNRDEN